MNQLSNTDLELLCNHAIIAAKNAAQVINAYSKKKKAGENIASPLKKAGSSLASQLLTQADLASDECIRRFLQETIERYDLGLLTEEGQDDKRRLRKDYFWCIDPLDGTLAFVEGKAGYAVSIALVSKAGEPVVGVVVNPSDGVIYSAIRGQGARRNGEPWTPLAPSKYPELDPTSLNLSFDQSFKDSEVYHEVISHSEHLACEIGCSGLNIMESSGAVMNAINILSCAHACYFKLPKSELGGGSIWDFAATAVIFDEVTAYASDAYGAPLKLNSPDSTFMNDAGVVFATNQNLAAKIKELIKIFA